MTLDALQRSLERTLIRLRAAHPFFGALALFADFRLEDRVETAATDGRTIWIAPAFATTLEPDEFGGVVVHELLHCALGHIPRMRSRNPKLWNLAADVVVNGMIRSDTKFSIPLGSVEEPKLAHLSVEEIYERLESRGTKLIAKFSLEDLLPADLADGAGAGQGAEGSNAEGEIAQGRNKALEAHWQLARHQAITIARRLNPNFGSTAMGSSRELARLDEPRIPWRDHLWQFVVRTPTDFMGFDRRALWRGLYLDAMDGERVSLRVCIDTSGSIGGPMLASFLSEILGILRAYRPVAYSRLLTDEARSHLSASLGVFEPEPVRKGKSKARSRPGAAAPAKAVESAADALVGRPSRSASKPVTKPASKPERIEIPNKTVDSIKKRGAANEPPQVPTRASEEAPKPAAKSASRKAVAVVKKVPAPTPKTPSREASKAATSTPKRAVVKKVAKPKAAAVEKPAARKASKPEKPSTATSRPRSSRG